MANGNGAIGSPNGKLLWWIIGLLTTGAMGVGTSSFHTLQINSERIAVLESRINRLESALQHIENKIDRLVEHLHPKD